MNAVASAPPQLSALIPTPTNGTQGQAGAAHTVGGLPDSKSSEHATFSNLLMTLYGGSASAAATAALAKQPATGPLETPGVSTSPQSIDNPTSTLIKVHPNASGETAHEASASKSARPARALLGNDILASPPPVPNALPAPTIAAAKPRGDPAQTQSIEMPSVPGGAATPESARVGQRTTNPLIDQAPGMRVSPKTVASPPAESGRLLSDTKFPSAPTIAAGLAESPAASENQVAAAASPVTAAVHGDVANNREAPTPSLPANNVIPARPLEGTPGVPAESVAAAPTVAPTAGQTQGDHAKNSAADKEPMPQTPIVSTGVETPIVSTGVEAPRFEVASPPARIDAGSTPATQIQDQVKSHLDQLRQVGRVQLQLDLHPPELGRVQLHLAVEDGHVNVRMTVQDENARRVLDQQVEPLRARFAEMGVSVGQFDVRRDGSSANSEQRQPAEPSAQTLQPVGTSAPRPQKNYGMIANTDALVDVIA